MYDSGEFSKNVADGSFKGIYPGCYIIKTKTIDGVTYTDHIDMIVSLDPYYGKWNGTSHISTHHIGIVPFTLLGKSYMNSKDVTSGGFKSSYMVNTTLPKYLIGYKNAYGADHFLTFASLITNSINDTADASVDGTSRSNGWEWLITQITLLSEVQVYGSTIFGSSYDTGEACNQLDAFRYKYALQNYQFGDFWLRGIAKSGYFTYSDGHGYTGFTKASSSLYVRPLLLLY